MNSVYRAKKFFSLSFSHSYPHSLFQFLSHFKFQKFLSFHSTRFHFISFYFYFISFPFHFRFPSGCRSYRGRISNFNFHPAATSGAILTTLSMLRPCSVASSYKGLPPRVMCAHRRELVFVHTSFSRPVGDFLVIREDTLDEWGARKASTFIFYEFTMTVLEMVRIYCADVLSLELQHCF